jgi:hypothetical protein
MQNYSDFIVNVANSLSVPAPNSLLIVGGLTASAVLLIRRRRSRQQAAGKYLHYCPLPTACFIG